MVVIKNYPYMEYIHSSQSPFWATNDHMVLPCETMHDTREEMMGEIENGHDDIDMHTCTAKVLIYSALLLFWVEKRAMCWQHRSYRDRNQEPGINSLLITHSSKVGADLGVSRDSQGTPFQMTPSAPPRHMW